MGGLGDVLRPRLPVDFEDFDLRFAPRVLHSTVHHGHRKRQRKQRWQSLPASFSLNFKELNPLFPHTLLHTKKQGIEGLTSCMDFLFVHLGKICKESKAPCTLMGNLSLSTRKSSQVSLPCTIEQNLPTCLRPSYGMSREWICVCCFSSLLNWQSNGDFSIVGLFLNFS